MVSTSKKRILEVMEESKEKFNHLARATQETCTLSKAALQMIHFYEITLDDTYIASFMAVCEQLTDKLREIGAGFEFEQIKMNKDKLN